MFLLGQQRCLYFVFCLFAFVYFFFAFSIEFGFEFRFLFLFRLFSTLLNLDKTRTGIEFRNWSRTRTRARHLLVFVLIDWMIEIRLRACSLRRITRSSGSENLFPLPRRFNGRFISDLGVGRLCRMVEAAKSIRGAAT